MKRSFAAWFTIWSNATPAKSENWSSTTGRRPVSAAPIAAADEAALGQRRVADALGAEALVEALGRAEEAADAADVLADHDHVGVGGELELERLADRRDEAERALARLGRLRVAAVRARRRTAAGRPGSRPRRRAPLDRGLDLRGDVALDLGDRVVVELELARASRGSGSFDSHSASVAGIAHVGQVRAHRVLHAAERLHLEQRRPVAGARVRERARDGLLDRGDVVAVDDLAGHPVAGGAVGDVLDRALRAPVGRERELVVLADEDDGQLPRRREVHPLVHGALAGGAVAEVRDRDLAGAAELRGQRGAAGVRDAGADDPVAAEDVEREVGDVHRAAEALAVAGALAEHLGHHPAEVGAGRDQVAVRAVVADEVVRLAHRARGADGDRLLADAAVRGADDHALLEELGGAVLEAPDQLPSAGTARRARS